MTLFSTLRLIALRGTDNNVCVQVTLVLLIGLSAKNALVIVEVENQSRETGRTILPATPTAAEEQLCSILMTGHYQFKWRYELCQSWLG